MAEDKIIKSGQITLPRLFFLGVCSLVLFIVVWTGELALGYILMTVALCIVLFLVAIDYNASVDQVDTTTPAQQPQAVLTTSEPTAVREPRARRRSTRTTKRRR